MEEKEQKKTGCEAFDDKKCTGCTGLAEIDWIGPNICKINIKYKILKSKEIQKNNRKGNKYGNDGRRVT